MEIVKDLKELRTLVSKEPEYSAQVTTKINKTLDEMIKVLEKGYGRVTSPAPSNITKHFSTTVGGGKFAVQNKMTSLKNKVIMNRVIPNDVTQWVVQKINTILRY